MQLWATVQCWSVNWVLFCILLKGGSSKLKFIDCTNLQCMLIHNKVSKNNRNYVLKIRNMNAGILYAAFSNDACGDLKPSARGYNVHPPLSYVYCKDTKYTLAMYWMFCFLACSFVWQCGVKADCSLKKIGWHIQNRWLWSP
jgi:hypothetical protein